MAHPFLTGIIARPRRMDGPMKSAVAKRSVTIGPHKTSISLEDAFWTDLRKIAHARGCALHNLIAEIDSSRKGGNLSSAIRVFVLEQLRARSNS
jgi:predicted DNA-binding ribbon-helix-helix protein